MSDSEFIHSILSAIDPEDFVKTIGFHTEKTRVLGKSIKTPCFIHKETTFASLIIDVDRKSFKCMKAGCKASQGGNLIELYSLYTAKSLNNAALSLAENLNISVDDSAVEELFETLRDKVAVALNESNWAELKTAIESLEAIRAHHFELNYWKAILKEKDASTPAEELMKLWEKALEDLLPVDAVRSLQILESRLLKQEPENVSFLKLKADLHDRNGEHHEEQKTLLQLLRLIKDRQLPEEGKLFERIDSEALKNDPELYAQWGRACEIAGQPERAQELFLLAEQEFQALGNRSGALEALMKASILIPTQTELAKRAYDELIFDGNTEQATQFLRSCIEGLLGSGKSEQALPLCKKLLNEHPKEISNWDLALHVYDALGDSSGKAEALLKKCELLKARGEDVADLLEEIEGILPSFAEKDQLLQLSNLFYESGKKELAFELVAQLMLESSKTDSDEEQLSLLRKVMKQFALNHDLQRKYLALLKTTGSEKEWKEEAVRLIRAQNNEPSVFDSVVDELEASSPNDLSVKLLRLERLIKAKTKPELLQKMAVEMIAQASPAEARGQVLNILQSTQNTAAFSPSLLNAFAQFLAKLPATAEELSSPEISFVLQATTPSPSLLFTVIQSASASPEEKTTALMKAAESVLDDQWAADREKIYEELTNVPQDETTLSLRLNLAEKMNRKDELEGIVSALCNLESVQQNPSRHQKYLELLAIEFPENIEALERLAAFHQKRGNLNEATNLLINQAELLEQKGELEKASKILSTCREQNPENLLVQRKLVKLLLDSGNKEEALQSLEKIAKNLQESGQRKDAVSTWREVLLHQAEHAAAKANFLKLCLQIEALRPAEMDLLFEILLRDYTKIDLQQRLSLARKTLEAGISKSELLPLLKTDFSAHSKEIVVAKRLEFYALAKSIEEEEFSWELLQGVPVDQLTLTTDLLFYYDQARLMKDDEKASKSLSRLVHLFNHQGKSAEALALLKPAMEEKADQLEWRLLFAHCLELTGASDSELSSFRLKTAELALAQKKSSVAESELKTLEAQFAHDSFVLEQSAKLYSQLKDAASVERLLSLAIENYLKQDHRELALELFDQLLEFSENKTNVLMRKAVLLRELDRFELAVEIYLMLLAEEKSLAKRIDLLRRILELNPKRNDLRLDYARLLAEFGQIQPAVDQFLKLYQTLRESDHSAARGYLQEALELSPDHAKVRSLRFLEAIEKAELSLAVEDAQFLIRHYKKQGTPEECVHLIEKLKEKFSDDHEEILRLETQIEGTHQSSTTLKSPRVKLAKKLAKEGRIAEAIDELEMALKESTYTLDAQRALIPLYIKSNEFEKAQQAYLKLIDSLLEVGNIDEATLIVDQLFHLDSQNLELRQQVASLFSRNSLPEVASEQYLWIARYYQEEKHFREAIRWSQRALECTPRSIDGRILLGTLHERLNQPNEASAQYVKAAELLVDNGSFEKAAQYVEQICRLMPESAEPREQLVKLYEQIGQRNRMAEQLEKLAKIYSVQHRAVDHVRVLKQIVQIHPDQTHNRTLLIQALKQNGNKEELFQFLMLQGDLYLKKGKTDHAIKVFGEALTHSADRSDAVIQVLEQIRQHASEEQFVEYGLQQVEYDLAQGNIQEVQMVLNMLSTAAQKHGGYQLAMAALYEATSQTELAKEAIKKAESLAESNATPNQKISLYKKMIKVSPNHFPAWRMLIRTYRATNQFEEAQSTQQKLALKLAEKGMHQEAVLELRALLQLDPENLNAWEQLFTSYREFADEKDLQDDMLSYANLLVERGQYLRALEAISRVIRWDAYNIDARQAYVRVFLKVGKEEDLVEDYLTIADLLVSKNRLDEALHYFDKVTAIDPSYKNAEVRKTQTQRMKRGRLSKGHELSGINNKRPHEGTNFRNKREDATQTRPRATPDTKTNSAQQFLMEEMEAMDKQEEMDELRQIIQNYNDILSINPQNANVKVKLANLYLQLDEKQNALKELVEARDLYSNKGEIATCIEVCEKILELNPTDQRTRLQLKQTINKRDAFKALESAIIFSDSTDDSKL